MLLLLVYREGIQHRILVVGIHDLGVYKSFQRPVRPTSGWGLPMMPYDDKRALHFSILINCFSRFCGKQNSSILGESLIFWGEGECEGLSTHSCFWQVSQSKKQVASLIPYGELWHDTIKIFVKEIIPLTSHKVVYCWWLGNSANQLIWRDEYSSS